MKITTLQLKNFRSFVDSGQLELGSINILIGANNLGKSSLLRSLYLLQDGSGDPGVDVRLGATDAEILITVSRSSEEYWSIPKAAEEEDEQISVQIRRGGNNVSRTIHKNNKRREISLIPAIDPQHFVVPYLSKRKTATYDETVKQENAVRITPTMAYLAAKLARVANPGFPAFERYRRTCIEILGVFISAIPSIHGQRPGAYMENGEHLWIDQMGEGVPNIVALLTELAGASGKLFLIEELENDLHPSALKSLMSLIQESSHSNQFVISTHSAIVLQHLGGLPGAKVFSVENSGGSRWPVESQVTTIPASPADRASVLRGLGYSLIDIEPWDGWLILEESSAERIVRDYLVPWFVPALARVRTMSCGGLDQVAPVFHDFDRLFRFMHLETAYAGRAWVRVDGDRRGKEVVQRLQDAYSSWPPDHFKTFGEEQFELYYPRVFADEVSAALRISSRTEKRNAKRELLERVRAWLDEDQARGRAALAESASAVIQDLKTIADAVNL